MIMPSLKHAALQIHRDHVLDEVRRSNRERAQRPIRIIDLLITHLEELHLEGRKRVPARFDTALAQLKEALPGDLRPELRSRIAISHLMDTLYELQDELFARLGARVYEDDDGVASQGTSRRLDRAS
jgi:hypothetical protein